VRNSTGAIDIEAILGSLPPARPVGVFERWLDEDPERAGQFWALIDAGRARGHGIAALVEAWNAATGAVVPVKHNQVRVHLRERRERDHQKRG